VKQARATALQVTADPILLRDVLRFELFLLRPEFVLRL
jgi:hypothetical protein